MSSIFGHHLFRDPSDRARRRSASPAPRIGGATRTALALAMIGASAMSAEALEPTAATVVSSASPAVVQSQVTLSATILRYAVSAVTDAASGMVDFRDGSASIGTAPLDARGVGRVVTAGAFHTCAINYSGGAMCWGDNTYGQIGNNSHMWRLIRADVQGLTSGVQQIAAGDYHTCALTMTGGVKCWGRNTHGQLGNAAMTDSAVPVDVVGLSSGVSAITAGSDHTCALTTSGGVMCWGQGDFGRLGDGSSIDKTVPVAVSGLSTGVVEIGASLYHTCALTDAGGLKCWGDLYNGTINVGGTTEVFITHTPADVPGLTSGVTAFATGADHTCAVTTSGAVSCLGRGNNGRLGDGQSTSYSTPHAVPDLASGVAALAAGPVHTCALLVDGNVKCWGQNTYGQLGDGSTSTRSTPVAVTSGPADVVALTASGLTIGGSHTCAVTRAGSIWCWGSGSHGEIGDNRGVDTPIPTSNNGTNAAVAARARLTVSSLPIGAHPITAVYGGDLTHSGSTSTSLTQTILGLPTATTLVTSNWQTVYSESVTFIAMVTATAGTPTGTVDFRADGISLGSADFSSGIAVLTTTALSPGEHQVTAVYRGDATYATSTSASVYQAVGFAGTTVSLSASATSVTAVQSVTLTATAGPAAPATAGPAGDVAFSDNGMTLAWVKVTGSHASWTVPSFGVGTHQIDAIFYADRPFSESPAARITVTSTKNIGATTTTLTAAPSPAKVGKTVTLTATVAAPGMTPSAGTVTFKDGNGVIGTAALSSGSASLTSATLAIGSHALTAVYGGATDGATYDLAGSTSAPVSLTIEGWATTTSVAGSASPSDVGKPVTFTALVDAAAGGIPTGTVDFRHEATTFATAVLDPGETQRAIVTGYAHSCAVTAAGGVSCWGSNSVGQLGDLTTSDRPLPGDVSGLTSGVVSIGKGAHHSCAVMRGGGVKCWGRNHAGQLGDGTTADRLGPVDVSGLGNVTAVAGGDEATCALTGTGGVKCWGGNTFGGLGDGTTTARLAPVDVVGLTSGVAAISGGHIHVCALTMAGGVKCWGYNGYGGLGDGTTTDRSTPVNVVGLTRGVVAISSGDDHSCALTSGGAVKCWGSNPYGGLGDGTTNTSPVPVGVSGLSSGVTAVAAGAKHSCAVRNGGAWCWGQNDFGQLGDSATLSSALPQSVSGLIGGVATITAGRTHTCAILDAGGVACWGLGDDGQLGYGTNISTVEPVGVANLTAVRRAKALATTSALAAGTRSITAAYGGDALHATSTSSVLSQRIVGRSTTTTLVTSKTPTAHGELPTLTATVAGGGATPTGSVTFAVDGTAIGSATLDSGLATKAMPVLAAGAHTVVATYDGDATHEGSTSASLTQTVTAASTTTALSAATTSVPLGGSFTLAATVSPVSPGAGKPTGTVTLTDGAAVVGTITLVGGTGRTSVSKLGLGVHTLRATYVGDGDFETSTSTTSTLTVTRGTTTTTLSVAPPAPIVGQTVTLAAAVVGVVTPTGTVTFADGSTSLGTATLKNGAAAVSTAKLASGTHALTVTYSGDASNMGSVSAARSLTVSLGATTTTLAVDAAKVLPGKAVTLSAVVAANAPATGTPTGMVEFKDGATVLATVASSGGKASFVTSALTTGAHAVVATYKGSTSFAADASPAVTVTVDPRVGSEFRVNTRTVGTQDTAAAATLKAGGFVVAWSGDTGSGRNVYAQRYAADGARAGSEFRFAATTATVQLTPAITGTADGGFTTAWYATTEAGAAQGLYVQRRSATGSLLGTTLRLDTTTGSRQSAPALAPDTTGGATFAAWMSNRTTGGVYDVFAQRVDTNGKKLGTEIRVSTTSMAKIVSPPAVATLTGGDRIVVWASATTATAPAAIRAQRLTTAGLRSGSEVTISAATWAQSEPAVAATADGGYVVAWTSVGQDGSGKGVFARRFSATGAAAGAIFRVATRTAGDQSDPSVSARPGGGFTVGWTSVGQDGSGRSVHARRFGPTGTTLDVELRLNTTVAGDQTRPTMVVRTATDFLATWTSAGQDGSQEGIYGQRFAIAP